MFWLYEKLSPLKGDLIFLNRVYEKQVYNFFSFFRFIFVFSLIMAGVFLYLTILHLANYSGSNPSTLCDSYYPCSFFYSRFTATTFRSPYAFTFAIFAVLGYILTTYEWLTFDKLL
jgi:hypothetical protein